MSKCKKVTTLEKIQVTEGKFLRSIADVKEFLKIHAYLAKKFTFHLNRPELSEYVASLRFRRMHSVKAGRNRCTGYDAKGQMIFEPYTVWERKLILSVEFEFLGDGLVRLSHKTQSLRPYTIGQLPDKPSPSVSDAPGVMNYLVQIGYWTAHEAAEAVVKNTESELPEDGQQ